MKPMTWEPMTEEAVFEEGERYVVYTIIGDIVLAMCIRDGRFWGQDDVIYNRASITHYLSNKITNPNEEKP